MPHWNLGCAVISLQIDEVDQRIPIEIVLHIADRQLAAITAPIWRWSSEVGKQCGVG